MPRQDGTSYITAGGSRKSASLTGVILANTTVFTPGATGAVTAFSVSLPAGTLNANGKGLRIFMAGTVVSSANLKTLAVLLGGTTLSTMTVSTVTSYSHTIHLRRITQSSQQVFAWQTAAGTSTPGATFSATENLGTALNLVFQINNATTANDSTCSIASVEILTEGFPE